METGLFDVLTAVDVGINLVSISKILERFETEMFAHMVNSDLSRSSSVREPTISVGNPDGKSKKNGMCKESKCEETVRHYAAGIQLTDRTLIWEKNKIFRGDKFQYLLLLLNGNIFAAV